MPFYLSRTTSLAIYTHSQVSFHKNDISTLQTPQLITTQCPLSNTTATPSPQTPPTPALCAFSSSKRTNHIQTPKPNTALSVRSCTDTSPKPVLPTIRPSVLRRTNCSSCRMNRAGGCLRWTSLMGMMGC